MSDRYIVTVRKENGYGCLVFLLILTPFILLVYNGLTYSDWTPNIADGQATATAVGIARGDPYNEDAGRALLGNGATVIGLPNGDLFAHLGPTGTLTFDNITFKDAGKYSLAIYYAIRSNFSVQLVVNNEQPARLLFDPHSSSLTATIILMAGTNKIEFFHAKGSGNECDESTTVENCDIINGIIVKQG